MKFNFYTAIALMLSAVTYAQETVQVGKEFSVSTNPSEGMLYAYTGPARTEQQLIDEVYGKNPESLPYFKKLGDGTFTLEIDDYDDDFVTLVAIRDGYLPAVKSFSYNKELKREVLNLRLELTTRMFQLDAEPYDAFIYIDGEKVARPYPVFVGLGENSSKTVEVRRDGFVTISEVFYNQEGKPEPPQAIKTFSLKTRVVHLEASPADGAHIYVNGTKVGDSHADVTIGEGECAVVRIMKEGFVTSEKTYCNKSGSPMPPVTDKINLSDREIAIRVPEGSIVRVNGKEVGNSDYTLKLGKGSEAMVEVEKKGYVTYMTTLYNNESQAEPPVFIALSEGSPEFPEDESFTSSTESDIANRDFVLSIPVGMTEDDAWRIIAQITQTYFDELQQIDKETGYIRTAWVYKRYVNRTVRTRLIIKINNREPLKYSVKISSEENSDRTKLDSRDDDDYKPWSRVLNQYKDIISEMQARLR
jgi:hypothetical protein